MNETNNSSPDMVRYASVISVITESSRYFKSEKDMAKVIQRINALTKYDLKPVGLDTEEDENDSDFFVEYENPDLTGIKEEIEKLEKFYERVSSTMSNYERIMAKATLVELRARLTMLEMKMKTRSF